VLDPVESDLPRAMSTEITPVARVLWLSPSTPAERSIELIAPIIGDRAEIVPKPLDVWADGSLVSYTLDAEVEAVRRVAAGRRWPRFHIVGFSAGATVALICGRLLAPSVATVALIEPATIGDDDWSPGEADWRARMQAIFELPPAPRNAAFRRAMMHPDEPVPPPSAPASESNERGLALEQALARTGYASSDWAALTQPLLVVTGGRSHPRFAEVSTRLCEVVPHAAAATFPSLSHLQSPQRHEPERLSALLLELWSYNPVIDAAFGAGALSH
jgi:pimeloyl-ACP methyl ester carboxylesterase